MSDPMTNVQIEDVLSSIRKLVAEGEKPRDPVGQTAGHNAVASDKLILTDALRVSNEDHAPTANEEDALSTADDPVDAPSEPVATPFVLHDAVEDAVEIVFDEDDADDLNATSQDTSDTVAEPVNDPATFRHFDREALSRNETLLRAMEMQDAEIEPEGAYEDEMIADVMDDPQIDERLNAFLSDEAILADAGLDESVLRQMIVDIIREELQGTMGERITRNVRKLVRREIARTLAAQDID